MMEELVTKNIGNKSCGGSTSGTQDPALDFIAKGTTGDTDYPVEACPRYVHGGAQINTIQVNTAITGSPTCTLGAVSATTVSANEVTASGITLTSRKAFDIQHPTKEGWRLRHICLEGPESAVYYRGKMKNTNVIHLPDYWFALVDPESITINLTPIGIYQELYVEKISWGKNIIVKNREGGPISCHYVIYGERIDGEKLIVEYEGDQYPGDNSQYSINK
jgi:hypothetical protein